MLASVVIFLAFGNNDIKTNVQTLENEPLTSGIPVHESLVTGTSSATTTDGAQVSTDTNTEKVSSQVKSSAQVIASMRLTFEENFNTLSRYLDKNGNITCEAGGTGIWQSVYHFCSRTNPSNYENEIYVDPNFIDHLNRTSKSSTTATNPTTVANGILTIEAKPSDDLIKNAAGPWAKYTSGFLTTQFSFAQQYGYFEMRAQVPAGEGLWPAFWLLPVDKSWPPEIDVMESFGGYNARNEGGLTQIHFASHTVKKGNLCGDWYDTGVDITKGFHTYGVNWQKDSITYYFDGKAYGTCPGNPDANQPFYLLINLAVGSDQSWPGSPDATTVWPAYMYVDYVRAYQTN